VPTIPVPVNKATVDVEQWRQTLEALRLMADHIAALESQKVGNR
jgi:hypothetical protein